MSSLNRSDREREKPVIVQAVLISVQQSSTSDTAVERSLDELEHLVSGLGMQVKARVVQKRDRPAAATYLGEGKLAEVAALTGGTGKVLRGPDVSATDGQPRDDLFVIADDELVPAQIRNLEAALGAPVLDRTSVILRVFEARAKTKEAKLEVELAALEYELPRVRDDHSLGDREGGGGRASRGHTNVELAKQRIRDRLASIRKQLEHERAVQEQQRLTRSETFRVALIGYTNAGKSSLMRSLTGSDVLVEDKLFATLGTTVRPLRPAAVPPVLIVDTVGFISRLPHGLIASFRATLSEANEAWLLLNVVDASDPEFRSQLRVTEQVVREIGAASTPAWVVLNKVDKLPDDTREALAAEYPEALQVCALDAADGRALWKQLVAFFDQHLVREQFSIPYSRHGVLAAARNYVRVLREDFGERIDVAVAATPEVMGRLRKQLQQESTGPGSKAQKPRGTHDHQK